MWNARISTNVTLTIRKIFKLRDLVQRHIYNWYWHPTFLWLDNWHPLGPLCKRFGDTILFNLGRSSYATVDSVIHQGRLRWPRPRYTLIMEIIAIPLLISSLTLPNMTILKFEGEWSIFC